MPSHVIVGASRGIGYGFLENLSKDPANTVIGLVRSVGPTQQKVDEDGLKNVTILSGDMTDYKSLVAAAGKVASITGGAADHVWINGAYLSGLFNERFLSEWDDEYPKMIAELQTNWSTNVIGVINAINAFLPLVKKSSVKKIVTISSGHADYNLINKFGLWEDAPYAISKGAANLVVAKYDARFRSEGILFLSLSPGLVDTGHFSEAAAESELFGKFVSYNPNMAPPITPAKSVESMLNVVAQCDAEHDGGQFYSHMGKHQGWLNSR